jgi:ribose transport system permease protein
MKSIVVKTAKVMMLPIIAYSIFLAINFRRFSNLSCLYAIFLQSIIPTITAYAISFGYICGIFDFTIGSRLIITGLVGGILSAKYGMAGLIIGCMAASLVISAITGLFNWLLKIPSLVLTIGLTMIFEIFGKSITGRFSFVSIDYQYAYLGAAPHIIIILIVSAVLFHFINNYTKYSYHMRAVGSNEVISKNAGIKTEVVKYLSFIIGSAFIGIAALLMISQSGSMGAQVNLGSVALMFKPLMSVMIAIVLKPLCNMTFGMFISQITINTIFIGLIAAGMPDTFQNVMLGVFLLVVMIFSNSIIKGMASNQVSKVEINNLKEY